MYLKGPHLLSFLKLTDETGTLVTTQNAQSLPFAVKRVFWVYGTPARVERGGHAHHTTQEVLSVLKGSVRIETESAEGRQVFELDNPAKGLYIPALCWVKVIPSAGAVLCCLTSTLFNEADYIRDYAAFQQLIA